MLHGLLWGFGPGFSKGLSILFVVDEKLRSSAFSLLLVPKVSVVGGEAIYA